MNKVPLPGSERPEPPGSKIGALAADERFSVSVVLRPRSGKGERFPVRPANQRLTQEEFVAMLGADPQDFAKIQAFATKINLAVVGIYPDRRTVDLSRTTADFGKAFQVDLAFYKFAGEMFRGHDGATDESEKVSGQTVPDTNGTRIFIRRLPISVCAPPCAVP
jgi:hypothetical protein